MSVHGISWWEKMRQSLQIASPVDRNLALRLFVQMWLNFIYVPRRGECLLATAGWRSNHTTPRYSILCSSYCGNFITISREENTRVMLTFEVSSFQGKPVCVEKTFFSMAFQIHSVKVCNWNRVRFSFLSSDSVLYLTVRHSPVTHMRGRGFRYDTDLLSWLKISVGLPLNPEECSDDIFLSKRFSLFYYWAILKKHIW